MGRIIGPEPGVHWKEKIKAEAGNLTRALFENFKHCINICMEHVPDKVDPANRAEVFQTCAEAFTGGLVTTLATYGNYTPDFEQMVIDEIRARFKFIRDNENRLQTERLEEMKNNQEKGKLIDVTKKS